MASRFHTLHRTYCMIAIESFEEYVTIKKSFDLVKDSTLVISDDIILFKKYVNTVVFSHMALEAYSYDLLCLIFRDDIVQNHFEKLSLIDRFVLIIKSIDKKNEIRKEKDWYKHLLALNKTRNYFVHSKSMSFNSDNIEKIFEKYEKQKEKNISIENAIKVLFLTDDYIDELIDDKIEYFELILSKRFELLEEDIERCKLYEIKKKINLTIAST